MTESCNCRRTLTTAFEEAALALGGVVASYPLPDEAVWDLARALDLIHERALGRCGAKEIAVTDDFDDAEHPAIAHLLARLRSKSGAGESDRKLR
jgi:hypothetical protein